MGKVKITDPMFAKAIADLSANGTLFFTPKQLFYLLENRVRKKAAPTGCLLFFLFVFFNIWAPGFIGGILAAVTHNTYIPFIFASMLVNLGFVVFLVRGSQSSQYNDNSRKQSARSLQTIGGIILVGGMVISLFVLKSFPIYLYTVLLGMSAIYLGTRQRSQQGISQTFLTTQQDFQTWLLAWQRVNPAIAKMLPPPRETNQLAAVDPDITAYSFDRLVVCDKADIAQLLIANNFHFENNCAILSITGYPQSIFATTMEMLRRNPDLKVYTIHDCTPKGIQLVHHLQSSANWFQNSQIPIFDIGLLPRQIIASKGMFIQSSTESALAAKQLPSEVRQKLSAAELTWLEAGNFVELESFSPQKLIRVLNHGIANSRDLGSDDSSLILIGDSGSYIYASDNFG
jgi:hypothetical protein